MVKKFLNDIFRFVIKHENSFLIFVFMLISAVSLYVVLSHNMQLSIEDGRAHLNIARRVFDSQTPGLTQLGGIWLPFPHIVMFPFIWNDTLWHSGFAGIIPSMLSYILSSLVIYHLSTRLFKNRLAGLLSVCAYSLNPNLLFIQSTPMSESMSLFFLILSAYLLYRWIESKKTVYLISTAIFVCLGTLTRYDNWVLPVVSIFVIFVVGLLQHYRIRRTEGLMILFLVPSIFGMCIWFIYNYLIFGSVLNFAKGEGSARWFAKFEAGSGLLPAKGNIFNAVYIYGANMYDVIGPYVLGLACLGFIVFCLLIILRKIRVETSLIILFLLSPILFNIFSLYTGSSVMWSQWVEPHRIYNVRYALQALPVVAVLIGALAFARPKILVFLVMIFIIITNYLFFYGQELILIRDITQTKGSVREDVGRWIKENPSSGLTLISASANEVVIFDSGQNIDQFVYEGNKPIWDYALAHPEKYVDRIIMGSNTGVQTDKVYNHLYGSDAIDKNFKEVYSKGDYRIYERVVLKLPVIKSVDTMKTSRDMARRDVEDVDYIQEIRKIKMMGANYVAVDTPYDEEFYPVLKAWAQEAHKQGLNVWFRGNWSAWEGWFEYPKDMTPEEHISETVKFIKLHPELFQDGDSFTSCPECEYGGVGSPLKTGKTAEFREFLVESKSAQDKAFSEIGRDVYTNWQSMNPDVARVVVNKEFLSAFENQVTLDYFAPDVKTYKENLDFYSKKYPGVEIMIGEFGAPIPDIHGKMTESQQANFVKRSFEYFYSRGDIVGINYWVCCKGTTAVLDEDNDFKQAARVIREFFVKND